LRVDYWTVNEPALASSLAALGADGIMTDDPAVIVPALRR
jgi:glycerophosphoryl diester phosphodiesterase